MNKETKTSENELVLETNENILEEAREIAIKNANDKRSTFILSYDVNQRDTLVSVLQTLDSEIVSEENEGHTMTVHMNMAQLKLVKSMDCVTKVSNIKETFFETVTTESEKGETPRQTMTLSDDATAQEISVLSVGGNESVSMACIDDECSSDSGCSDFDNTTMHNPKELRIDSFLIGRICCPGAEQWFVFAVPETGEYTIYTTGDLDTEGCLYDNSITLINQVDDVDCGDLNFRMVHRLIKDQAYFLCVKGAKSNTGEFRLYLTGRKLVDRVEISPSNIVLEVGKTYELPTKPGRYFNIEGTTKISGLSVSLIPNDATQQTISWSTADYKVLEIVQWFRNNERYATVKPLKAGTATLYASDWNENGERAACEIEAHYCGGDNYRDVTQHSMILQSDGYYVCSKCGYRIKSPALQDKDILSQDDYLKMVAVMHYYAHNVLLAREYPISAYFYNAEAEKCKIVMDTIRSQNQYSSAYEYQGLNKKYLAGETNDTMLSFVSKSAINLFTIGSYNSFYETIATLVIGYYCPPIGTLTDIISLAEEMSTGEMDAISFGSFVAGLIDLDDIATALSLFSSASNIIDCDVVIGDPVIRISFSAYAHAEYVFDTSYNIKKVSINYTV